MDDARVTAALLEREAKPYEKDKDGNTPMALAMTHGSMAFLCAFLRAAM